MDLTHTMFSLFVLHKNAYMHSFINNFFFLSSKYRRTKTSFFFFFVNIIDMNPATRSSRKYYFRNPDLSNLRELGSRVTSQRDFQAHHGRLLSILQTKVEEGVLNTLVQMTHSIIASYFPITYWFPLLKNTLTWMVYRCPMKYPSTTLNPFLKPQPLLQLFTVKPPN